MKRSGNCAAKNRAGGANVSDRPAGVEWAFDTETQGGRAVLLTVAGPSDQSAALEFPSGFAEGVRWLSMYSGRFVAYNMDYDARALLKFLPQGPLLALYRDESVSWRGYRIGYRAGKEFTVHGPNGLSVACYDIASFFQTSLAEAARKLLKREGKDAIPKSWYARMGDVLRGGGRARLKLLSYALKDAATCRALWVELDRQFRALGVPAATLARPLSPGNVASGYFGKRLRFPGLPQEVNWLARRAYAGGRIEVYQRGYFPRVWAYDINSAYPAEMAALPDPRGLEVFRGRAVRSDALYAVYKVRANIPESVRIPPLVAWHPAADKLRIYPVGRWTTWVTGPEFDLLRARGWLDEVYEGCGLLGSRRPWLAEIAALYKLRRERPEISQAIKLVLNSVYGKLAQIDDRQEAARSVGPGSRSIGGKYVTSRERLSSTSNFFVAAYVTAGVRLKVWRALEKIGWDACILSATDGILARRRLPAGDLGAGLGEWSQTLSFGRAVVVGAGVYALGGPEGWSNRLRGYRSSVPLRTLLDSGRTRLRVVSRVAYTLAEYALKGSALNEIVDVPRMLNVNFDRKRAWARSWDSAREILRRRMGSGPLVLLDEPRGRG